MIEENLSMIDEIVIERNGVCDVIFAQLAKEAETQLTSLNQIES